ncbi:MAG: DUF6273 domain-containing protein, partial [Coriobacteriales bacterium]|nr:DUF6273 domain-containing protein [Coriobacteriales bacterium]
MCIMLAVPSTAFAVTYHTLYLDANGGEWSNGQKVLSITRDTKTPTVTVTGATQKLDDGTYVTVTLKNHKFVGWNTLANGLGCSYKTLPVNFSLACADKTLYAMWEYSPDPVPDPEPISGSITYNLNDAAYYGSAARNGGVEKESLLAGALLKTAAHYSDDPASTLAPTLQGYIFTGWYLDPEATQPAADAKIPEPHVGTKIAQIPAGGTFVEAGIVWRVLVNDGSEVIVISNDVIEKGKWNDLCKDVPWSDSTIRTYLNNTFYNRLSADFQSLIVPQTLTTRVKAWATCYDKYGTEQTVDKVFLLSAAEAFYVGTDNALIKNACYPQLTTQTAATRFNGNTPLFYSAGARAASSDYWLRDRGLCALLSGAVTAKGAWTEHTVTSLYGIRPVMVLDVSDYVDDPNLNVTVYAGWEREKNGRGPTMTVPSPQEITATTAAEAYDPIKAYKPDGSDAVSAIDDDGRDVTDEIVVYRADGTTLLADDPIYTNEPDIYVLKYVVTGSDDETSEAWRVVVINDGSYVVDSKYVLQAKPFSVPFEDAPTAVADTISLAQAKAWDISNPPALPTTEVIVTNDGGYKQYPATYNITYAVKAKASVAKTVAGTLTGVWDKVAPIISATSPVEVAKWSDWDDITGVA